MQAMSFKEYVEINRDAAPHVMPLLFFFLKMNQGSVGFFPKSEEDLDGYIDHRCLYNLGVDDNGYFVMFENSDLQALWSQWQASAASTLSIIQMHIDHMNQIAEFKKAINDIENGGIFKRIWTFFKYRKHFKEGK